ncbi:MAG: TolC family protein [Kiritimatiellia bacterium]
MSDYELQAVTEALLADVESAYRECVLAQRRIGILEDSLALAERQFREVQHRIRVGSLPETELAAVQAETAVRREALLNARSAFSAAELRLLRLIAPRELGRPRGVLTLATEPVVPADELGSVQEHVAVAMRMRPELRLAELRLRKGELEVIRTRNGLLPRLDLFVRLGDTGYAQALREALAEIDGRDLSFSFGLSWEYPLANRGASARHRRALLSLRQVEESLANLADLVRLDVETAYIEVRRMREQVTATATTRQLQEEKLRSENAKFAVGHSTSLLVAQAQRDLLASQVAEIESVVKHLEALAAFFRAEGSLLLRRGIRMPEETSAGNLERIRDVR